MHQSFVTTAPTYGDGRRKAGLLCAAVTFRDIATNSVTVGKGGVGVGQWLQMTGALPFRTLAQNSLNTFTGRLDMT